MKILTRLDEFVPSSKPVVMTVGNFDGVHSGHQKLIDRVKSCALQKNAESFVLTFEGHPAELLHPDKPVCLICSLKHRIALLERHNLDYLAVLKFTREFADQTAEQFLLRIKQKLPLEMLILGHDAKIGKGKAGDRQKVISLAKSLSFSVEYLDPFMIDGEPVSSSRIRQCILAGNLERAKILLGRPYSIFGDVVKGIGLGRKLGFPTANVTVTGLCLPPYGVYAVTLKIGQEQFKGVANLGVAPTVRQDYQPLLEVHLFHPPPYELAGLAVEVIFGRFIRSEMKFSSIDELKTQIAQDIKDAQKGQ